MLKVYDTVVFGTGYFAYGYANNNQNTLIIEKGELSDKHFCGALKLNSYGWDCQINSPYLKKLKLLYDEYGLLYGKSADIASMESVLCEWLKNQKINILLLTEVIEIEKENDLFILKIYNNEGISTIKTKKLIDTTGKGILSPSNVIKKGIYLLTFNNADNFNQTIKQAYGEQAFFVEGVRENECAVFMPIGLEESVLDIKIRITDGWRDFISKTGARLSYIAPEVSYICDTDVTKVEENWYKVAECNFENGFLAYEFGYSFAFGGDKK